MPLTFIQFVIHIGIYAEPVLDHRLIKVNLQKRTISKGSKGFMQSAMHGNVSITQDLRCQAEADTHVKGVMSTHCTLHTDSAPAHHALSRRDGCIHEQLKALITASI